MCVCGGGGEGWRVYLPMFPNDELIPHSSVVVVEHKEGQWPGAIKLSLSKGARSSGTERRFFTERD